MPPPRAPSEFVQFRLLSPPLRRSMLLDPGAAAAAGPGPFLAHQAAYDLSLKTSRRSPSVEAAEGRIVYNFSGSECEGYTTDFRQVSRLNTGEGRRRERPALVLAGKRARARATASRSKPG